MPQICLCRSNRIICKRCNKIIRKDKYRIGVKMGRWHHSKVHWYHIRCYSKSNSVRIPPITSGLRGYNALPGAKRKKVRKALWPVLVSNRKNPRIRLCKEFRKLTVKDLKLELKRRDLKYNGNKEALQSRLEAHLESKSCKHASL